MLLRLPLSLPTPLPCRPSMPTHMQESSRHRHCPIWQARKIPSLAISSTSVLQCFQKWMLWAMAKFLGREVPLTKQTAAPSSQLVYLQLACQQRWTALPNALFWKVPRGGPFFSHRCRQHDVHIIVILIVINAFFCSFNDVDLFWLIVVCLGARSGAPWRLWKGCGHHGWHVCILPSFS